MKLNIIWILIFTISLDNSIISAISLDGCCKQPSFLFFYDTNVKVKKFIKSNFDLYQKLINELHSPKYQKSIDIGFILLSNEFRGQIIHAFLQ